MEFRSSRPVLLTLLLMAFSPGWQGAGTPSPPAGASVPEARFPGGQSFHLEVALTPEEHAKGYMFRDRVGPDEGMIFLFSRDDFHAFWMKNCRVSLDLIWLSDDRRVVYMEVGAPPCRRDPCPSYLPLQKARYVLEIAAGGVKRSGLKVGDLIQFQGVDFNAPSPP
jgi:uncharacterized membrane protein (UPF0127 family)